VHYIVGQNGQRARIGIYGLTEDGLTMRITYDHGGRKVWSRPCSTGLKPARHGLGAEPEPGNGNRSPTNQ